MPKKTYEFVEKKITTVVIDNDCECDENSPCLGCDAAAWDAFDDEDGTVKELPIHWGVV
jgi:hypothetical protein